MVFVQLQWANADERQLMTESAGEIALDETGIKPKLGAPGFTDQPFDHVICHLPRLDLHN